MKKRLSVVVGGLFLLFMASTGFAQTTFTESAAVPLASGVTFTVNQITGTTWALQSSGTTSLNFGTLVSTNVAAAGQPASYIYLPTSYFAIDISAAGGSGVVTTQVQYAEGTNPNGTTNGFGSKATATFDKVTTTSDTPITSLGLAGGGAKTMLAALTTAFTVPSSAVTGGWLRVYLGIWSGSTAAPADPTTGQPFTTGDAHGTYTGQLTFTTTVS